MIGIVLVVLLLVLLGWKLIGALIRAWRNRKRNPPSTGTSSAPTPAKKRDWKWLKWTFILLFAAFLVASVYFPGLRNTVWSETGWVPRIAVGIPSGEEARLFKMTSLNAGQEIEECLPRGSWKYSGAKSMEEPRETYLFKRPWDPGTIGRGGFESRTTLNPSGLPLHDASRYGTLLVQDPTTPGILVKPGDLLVVSEECSKLHVTPNVEQGRGATLVSPRTVKLFFVPES